MLVKLKNVWTLSGQDYVRTEADVKQKEEDTEPFNGVLHELNRHPSRTSHEESKRDGHGSRSRKSSRDS